MKQPRRPFIQDLVHTVRTHDADENLLPAPRVVQSPHTRRITWVSRAMLEFPGGVYRFGFEQIVDGMLVFVELDHDTDHPKRYAISHDTWRRLAAKGMEVDPVMPTRAVPTPPIAVPAVYVEIYERAALVADQMGHPDVAQAIRNLGTGDGSSTGGD